MERFPPDLIEDEQGEQEHPPTNKRRRTGAIQPPPYLYNTWLQAGFLRNRFFPCACYRNRNIVPDLRDRLFLRNLLGNILYGSGSFNQFLRSPWIEREKSTGSCSLPAIIPLCHI